MADKIRLRHGLGTGTFGKKLTARLKESADHMDWYVFYDHGDVSTDKNVASIKGFYGDKVTSLNRITDVDILIASPDGTVKALVEIEERNCSPKKILGDVLASLICNHFAVKIESEQKVFRIDPSSKLIVAGIAPGHGYRLRKVDEIIGPRLHQLQPVEGGINPSNVELIFAEDIAHVMKKLESTLGFFEDLN